MDPNFIFWFPEWQVGGEGNLCRYTVWTMANCSVAVLVAEGGRKESKAKRISTHQLLLYNTKFKSISSLNKI